MSRPATIPFEIPNSRRVFSVVPNNPRQASIPRGEISMPIADERAKAVELALSQIEKQFGKGSIVRLGSREALVPIAVISTGSISFDAALGVGGVPRGRVIEVFGPESSGKTTITLQI